MWRKPRLIVAVSLPFVLTVGAQYSLSAVGAAAVSGNFSDNAKWVGGMAPTAVNGEVASFGVNGTYTVTFIDDEDSAGFNISQGNLTFASSGGVFSYNARNPFNPPGVDSATVSGTTLTLGTSGNPLNLDVPTMGLSSSATVNVKFGSVLSYSPGDETATLRIGENGAASSMVVDGAGSTLRQSFSYTQQIGHPVNGIQLGNSSNGSTGNLTFQNGASGDLISDLYVGYVSSAGSLTVQSGSILQAGRIIATGNVIVDGTGSAINLRSTEGSPYLGVGSTLNVNNGASVSVGLAPSVDTGFVSITGSLNLGTAGVGTLQLNGSMNIFGGVFTRHTGSTFNFTSGSMTLLDSSLADFFGSYTFAGTSAEIQHGSILKTEGAGADLSITLGGNIAVNAGMLQVANSLKVGNSTGGEMLNVADGTVTVGADLSANSGGSIAVNGGVVSVTNAMNLGSIGSGSFDMNQGTSGPTVSIGGDLNLGHETLTSGIGILSIHSGTLAAYEIHVGDGGRTSQAGTLAISGGALTQSAANVLTVGASINSTGTVTVDGGTLTTGAGTVLNSTGVINVNDGTVDLKAVTQNGGHIVFDGGTLQLQVSSDAVINQQSGLFRTNILTLYDSAPSDPINPRVGNALTVIGTLRVDPNSALVINGGQLTTSAVIVKGILEFDKGTANINGAGGLTIGDGSALGSGVTMGPSNLALLTVTNTTTVNANSQLLVSGGRLTTGTLSVLGNSTLTGGNLSVGTTSVASGANFNANGGAWATSSLNNSGTVSLAAGTTSTITSTLNNQAGGLLLLGTGATLVANGAASNAGDLNFAGTSGSLNGTGTLANTGVIHGDGIVAKPVANNFGGEIRAESGKRIKLSGVSSTNNGKINLQGGTAEFSQPLTNGSTGQIIGRGALITGGTGLLNNGNVAFSGGVADVFGKVNNSTGSTTKGITISGNSNVTFWDDVTNASGSLFRVSSGSAVTVFGSYSGAGISGTGSVYYESDISPGFSPATVDYGGNVTIDATARLNIEIGGLNQGSQFDHVNIAGALSLAGTLAVSLIEPYSPAAGDTFDVLDWPTDGLTGTFSSLQLPPLSSTSAWDTAALYTSGVLSVVLVGDLDRNTQVNSADLAVLLHALTDLSWYESTFTATYLDLQAYGDVNKDDTFNNADIQAMIWRLIHGPGPAPPPAAVSVPEPAGVLLMAIGALVAISASRARLYKQSQ